MKYFRAGFLFALMSFVFQPLTIAAEPPDSGQILQELKQGKGGQPARLPEKDEDAVKEDSSDSDLKVRVSGFSFRGYEEVTTKAELLKLLEPVVGKKVTLAELQQYVDRITNFLRDKGYFLARAYLPPQEIVDGIVEIVIITGRVEGTPVVKLSESARLKKQIISSMAKEGATSGNVLQQGQLERSILLINDLPAVSAKSILERGDTPGTTKVIIEAEEGPLFNGVLSVNNFGNRYTGKVQTALNVAANDLTGYGDQLSLSTSLSQRLTQGTLAYQTPLGTSGLKGSVAYTALQYELGKDYEDLDFEGTANTFSTQLSYPLIRTRNFSLWQALDYEHRFLEDEIGGTETSDRTLRTVSSNTTLNLYDRWGGGGLTNASFKVSAGDLDYGLATEAATDDTTAQAAGKYYTFSYNLSRLQRLTRDFSFFTALSGQLASQNLDSSEQFILGGPSGVRAYPIGEASGDEGHSLTTEVRYNAPKKVLSSNLQCVAFFDAGHIKLHDDPWTNSVTTATGENRYEIAGLGLGVNLDRPGRYSIRVSYAHVLGNNPGRTVDDKNADNKDDDQQVWLQAIVWF